MSMEVDGEAPSVEVIYGTISFGGRTKNPDADKILETVAAANVRHLDAGFIYSGGAAEKLLGESNAAANFVIDTKVCPFGKYSLSKESIHYQFKESCARLGVTSFNIFYLQSPDRKTPIEETLAAVNEIYLNGGFKEFGLSNYASWEVVHIYHICKNNGWILPSVYQGIYNYLTRGIEKELLPALRSLNIRFYAYNPLAGGILTGKHSYETGTGSKVNEQPISRFFAHAWADIYRDRYWKKGYFSGIDMVRQAVEFEKEQGTELSMTSTALTWLRKHSALRGELGDAIVLGGWTVEQVEENLCAADFDFLPVSVQAAVDLAWYVTLPDSANYFK
eukprot:Nk52_evm31s78 gene=Nk52_evmTU31s78